MKKVISIITTILIIIGITIYIINNNKTEIEVIESNELSVNNELEEIKEEYKEKNNELKNYITVEIKGEVLNPGVYRIEENSRVIDLINIAGGLTENALTININQAKKLLDEMVIVIYNKNDLKEEIKTEYVYLECECPKIVNDGCINEDNPKEEIKEIKKISINTAKLEELTKINGIGEKTALKIIEYREKTKFNKIEEIMNVSGIGESLYEKIKDSITL